MNRHFSDARYYLGRAVEHLKAGLAEELTPRVERIRNRLDREEPVEEPETRADRARVVVEQSRARVEQGVSSAKQRARTIRRRDRPSA